jgi:FlaA1/EpsC-like NDP-sugar epimerase
LFLGLPLVTQLIANQLAGLYGPIWRYASVEEAARVVFAVGGGAIACTIELIILDRFSDSPLPVFTTPPVAALLVLLGCGGIRFQARLFASSANATKSDDRLRTLIVVRAIRVRRWLANCRVAYRLTRTSLIHRRRSRTGGRSGEAPRSAPLKTSSVCQKYLDDRP